MYILETGFDSSCSVNDSLYSKKACHHFVSRWISDLSSVLHTIAQISELVKIRIEYGKLNLLKVKKNTRQFYALEI